MKLTQEEIEQIKKNRSDQTLTNIKLDGSGTTKDGRRMGPRVPFNPSLEEIQRARDDIEELKNNTGSRLGLK